MDDIWSSEMISPPQTLGAGSPDDLGDPHGGGRGAGPVFGDGPSRSAEFIMTPEGIVIPGGRRVEIILE